MTQIRRSSAKPMTLPIIRVLLIVSLILSFTVFLFQLDAFPKRRKNETALTPDKLIEQGPLHPNVRQRVQDTNDETQSEDKETRRYVMELGNVKGSTGSVTLETYTSWAPRGANHFHELVQDNFYDECRFFRVVKNFMVQFGIAATPQHQKQWSNDVLQDDPVKQTNAVGTLTYATSGPNTWTTQLFINTKSSGNAYLVPPSHEQRWWIEHASEGLSESEFLRPRHCGIK